MSFILLGILNSQAEAAGGGAAYDLLETTILSSSTPSVTFSSLDTLAADYQHLQLRMTLRDDRQLPASQYYFRFNGDSSVSYRSHILVAGDYTSTPTSINWSNRGYIGPFEAITAANSPSALYGSIVADILDFSSVAKNTTLRQFGGQVSTNWRLELGSGAYFKNDAITSIEIGTVLGNNLVAGSRISLYGIRG